DRAVDDEGGQPRQHRLVDRRHLRGSGSVLHHRHVHLAADEHRRALPRARLIPFFLTSVVFWSMYQQIFGVLTVYSDTQLNRSIFGWEMPINWIQLIPAMFVIIFAPLFATMW